MAVAQKTGIPKWNPGQWKEAWTKTCGLPLLDVAMAFLSPLRRFRFRAPAAAAAGPAARAAPEEGYGAAGLWGYGGGGG